MEALKSGVQAMLRRVGRQPSRALVFPIPRGHKTPGRAADYFY